MWSKIVVGWVVGWLGTKCVGNSILKLLIISCLVEGHQEDNPSSVTEAIVSWSGLQIRGSRSDSEFSPQ